MRSSWRSQKLQRKMRAENRVQKGIDPMSPYGSGFRANANQMHIEAGWVDGECLTEADREVLRAVGGRAGLQRGLLAVLQQPGAQLVGTAAAPARQLVWLLQARAAALA